MKEGQLINSIGNPNNVLEPFKVYVRIRPFLDKEILRLKRNNSTSLLNIGFNKNNQLNSNSIFEVNKKTLYVNDIKHHKKEKIYNFDNIFTEKNNNKDVFDLAIKPIINNVINGYNSTALAYGVTGTGKTHTIFGDFLNGEEGIAIKACDYLFKKLSSKYFEDDYIIKVSYIEIYNENVIDLLNNESNSSMSLLIIEDPIKGIYCPNVKEYIINNSSELKRLISQGNKRRTMAPTNQNKFSSRSHAILQISLERKSFNEKTNNFDIFFSKFLIVDLAGSERGGQEKGKRREEGANINKSLFTLGSCINILSDKNKNGKFIPYRDSKLTRLLKDSLGGNILTVMLVCVSPCIQSYDESISSLNYATRAKKIKKCIYQNKKEICFLEGNNNINFRKNNNNNQYEEIIGSLKNEINQLKTIIKEQQNKLKNKNINNNTLNLEDDTIIKNRNNTPNCNQKFFIDDSEISSIQMDNSKINKNSIIYNNTNNINMNSSLIKAIDEIDIEKYNLFFEEIKNKDTEISLIKREIENIKNDKNNLELYLEQNHILYNENLGNIINTNENENNYDNPEKKYILIKNYYDKFLEIINDKLIENIEKNMILKCNIKEISELNRNNIDHLENLNKQFEIYKKNENSEEHDCEYDNINEQIKNIKNTIKENLMLKNEILKTYNENLNKKKELKQILLSLLGDKRENSNKLINILKDKEKLVEINKKFQKKIETYLKIQKKKDKDINIVQRQVEMLRAQLKEKEKTILELKQNSNNTSNNNNLSSKRSRSTYKSNSNSNINLYYIKKKKNESNNFISKGKRSLSNIRNSHYINNNINNFYNNNLKKNEDKKDDRKIKTFIYCYDASNDFILNNKNYIQNNTPNFEKNKNYEYSNIKKRNNPLSKSKSKIEEILEENNQYNKNIIDNNNYLFKKIIFNQNYNNNNLREKNINIIEDENGVKKIRITQEYTFNENNININNNNRKNSNELNKKIHSNNFNEILIKYNINKINDNNNINNYILKKDNSKIIYDYSRKNKRNLNLSQKRYEKFMNNRQYNNYSHNNNQEGNKNLLFNISKKINKQINKKLSLNEARYEKKIKTEKDDKLRDLSIELNHANAENFINSFKGMKIKQNNIEYLKNESNNFKNNNIYIEDNENINNLNINNYIDKNKSNSINNQNLSINMDGKCQIETKENDSTNFKTDQSKILKTDDFFQELINSIKNAPSDRLKNK